MLEPAGPVYTAEVPSNIALLKYWGKRDAGQQWPANDSLSMTLAEARTITSATAAGDSDRIDRIEVDGRIVAHAGSTDKAGAHLRFLRRELGFTAPLQITTRNTFPTGCGIASSASGLGALTLAGVAAWTGCDSFAKLAERGFPVERLAHLARLGSGSAGRSFFAGYVEWQAGAAADEQRLLQLDINWPLVDIIALVSSAEKSVSSSIGHQSAATSPLFLPRLAGLSHRLAQLKAALSSNDFAALGELIETEALDMHAVMLSSQPPLAYLLPETSQLMAWLRRERFERGLEAYFTVDAGPNVHILCPPRSAPEVLARLRYTFPRLGLLVDRTGAGPLLHRRPEL